MAIPALTKIATGTLGSLFSNRSVSRKNATDADSAARIAGPGHPIELNAAK
jgi:hypothetical protein